MRSFLLNPFYQIRRMLYCPYDNTYHMLYCDEQAGVTIYGKPIDENYPKVCLPAAVLNSVQENS